MNVRFTECVVLACVSVCVCDFWIDMFLRNVDRKIKTCSYFRIFIHSLNSTVLLEVNI